MSTAHPPISDAAERVLKRLRAVADPRATIDGFGSSVYASAHGDGRVARVKPPGLTLLALVLSAGC